MTDMEIKEYVGGMLEKARAAQKIYGTFSQKQLDQCSRACGKVVYDNAEIFAVEAVEETGMGLVSEKIIKQRVSSASTWRYQKGKPSTGVIGWEKGKLDTDCIQLVAKPVGVVAGIMPATNPTTSISVNGMQALKCGNAIIVCPHPRAVKVSMHCVDMIRAELVKLGAPADIIQCAAEASIEVTGEFMREADVVVATGGPGMVKAGNESGTPSFGVGQGNCQMLVDRGMQDYFDRFAEDAVACRSFDSGLPCNGEQTLIMPEQDRDAILSAFDRAGAMVVRDEAAIEKLRNMLYIIRPDGSVKINPSNTGKSAQELGQLIGVEVPADKRTLMVEVSKFGPAEPLCREKLCPVTAFITYTGTWEDAVAIARTNLEMEGAGHSAEIYTKDEGKQLYAAEQLPVCRVMINNSNRIIAGANMHGANGLIPTSGHGCGFWQGNIIDQNLNYRYLLNITRMVYTIATDTPEPTDEEIWAED